MTLQDHVIEGSCDFRSHQPAKFGGHRHCNSNDIFLVAEKQDSTCVLNSAIIIFYEAYEKKKA